MPILNKNSYPFFFTYGPREHHYIETRKETALWNLRNWDDADYWYCEITGGNAFHSFHVDTVIPPEILNKIKLDSTTFLVLANAHEAFHKVVDPLYQSLVLTNNIPPEKIILLSESADVHNVVKDVSKKYSVASINVEWTLIFEKSIIEKRKQYRTPVSTLEHKHYDKKYLCFNRRWRLHRPALVALLTASGILDNGLVSLGVADDGCNWRNTFDRVLQQHQTDQDLMCLLSTYKDSIMQLPNLYLDTTELKINQVDISEDNISLYRDTLVSIVTETNFYTSENWESGRFLSEKTFKPIAHNHPFILVTVPKTLELLRSLGYKTFSPWIDESYDLELDDNIRLKKIVKEINRISKFTDEEVLNFINGVTDIVKHNFNVLMSRNTHIYKTL